MNFDTLMRGFTIRVRMFATIGIVLALLLGLGGVGLVGLQRIDAINAAFIQRQAGESVRLGDLRHAFGNLRRYEKDMIIGYEKPETVIEFKLQWQQVVAQTQQLLQDMQATADPAALAVLQKMQPEIAAYVKAAEPVVRQLEASGYDTATVANRMLANAHKSIHNAEALVAELTDALQSASVDAQAASSRAQSQTILMFGAAVLFAIAVVVPLTLLNMRSICRPLGDARGLAEAIATGDLTRQVDTRGKDETAAMLAALATMQDRLRSMVGDIRQSADSISTASGEVASGNADLSVRTEQTASNLQQAASSMEQLTGTVRQSADSAQTANQLASSAAQVAQRGGTVVAQVVSTMDAINTSSKKIADIIGTIDGIAFQTNILALNAAVEAARAGEQGRGFAVVAAEVRSLAQRSAEAAKEIKALIGTSVDKVETGSRLVQDAGSTMSEIVASVQRVTDIIGEITAAASEQSAGIGSVNTSVNQLDQMTQQNAALVEESAAAAGSLQDQALRLNGLVSTFRLTSTA